MENGKHHAGGEERRNGVISATAIHFLSHVFYLRMVDAVAPSHHPLHVERDGGWLAGRPAPRVRQRLGGARSAIHASRPHPVAGPVNVNRATWGRDPPRRQRWAPDAWSLGAPEKKRGAHSLQVVAFFPCCLAFKSEPIFVRRDEGKMAVEEARRVEEEEEVEQRAWSWGAGTDGQLGTSGLRDELIPQPVSLPSVSLLSCGGAHVIALSSDGTVFTWGRGSSGQLGQGNIVNHCVIPKAVAFPEGFRITSASAGWSHSGFVSDCGRLFTCGDGTFGQLGLGDFSSQCSPIEVSYFASKHVAQIACGMRHSLVLLKGEIQNQVYGFGTCKRGQIGTVDVRTKSVNLPLVIDGFENTEIVSISANGDHSAALSDDGNVYNWGRGFRGSPDAYIPGRLDTALPIKQVALGWNHALMLTDGGEALMLGEHICGFSSDPTKMGSVNFPDGRKGVVLGRVATLNGVKVVDIAAGSEHSVLVTEDGSVKTWGWGEHGQLGLGDSGDHVLPQVVILDQDVANGQVKCKVYCGSGFSFAIKTRNIPM
ncbi:hypothetical protein SAY87_013140 [Trapa incisa]|uniref:RCC1-like domain-containing protein n=1 Tax=Trapa incisa TaxID=236973 RepID=A0AAN7KHM6_9MYRT|nr:hypothetical protein SAY87_013140 [Trapa incisa]